MIYLFTALYQEAGGLIREFGLVKNTETTWFQEFSSEERGIHLAVTGVGEIAAAAVVSSVCTRYRPGGRTRAPKDDFLVNFGVCGATEGTEGIFLCNRLTEQASGKTFYPDLLYRHAFGECGIVTGMRPWEGTPEEWSTPKERGTPEERGAPDGCLYDMEAAAVYQAGLPFFSPHRMVFLKIVSDNGAKAGVTAARTAALAEAYRGEIVGFLERLLAIAEREGRERRPAEPEVKALWERLCGELHCSQAMRDALWQYLSYASLAGKDCAAVAERLYHEDLLPCRDRREGKKCFEELKRRLL